MKNRPTAHIPTDSSCPSRQPATLLKRQSHNIIDLLRTSPPAQPFAERVKELKLSSSLENKILEAETPRQPKAKRLTANDEKELAGEALMLRHTFTCLVFGNRFFRQASLTVIQNIYLFRQRRIFFGTASDEQGEEERRQALLLFTAPTSETSVPLAKTFQHFILARVWDRIITQANDAFLDSRPFNELHEVVERLNTLRNIYMLLSLGMVQKMTGRISTVYQHSISADDARQIGNFGIARAAYRYHPSLGIRFSTYAAHWVLKEIQRQALEG
ncbi:MAG TPA: sigma factor, partial [Desulfopila sp.]|nr:sigma factor [Desulfopila sp.]